MTVRIVLIVFMAFVTTINFYGTVFGDVSNERTSRDSTHRPSPYEVRVIKKEHPLYNWEDVSVEIINKMEHQRLLDEQNSHLRIVGLPAASLIPYKVLVTMTTVSFRIKDIKNSLYSILNGAVTPTQVYVFISREGYLLDEGVKVIPDFLLTLITQNLVHVVYTDNIGPHRKLLPLLAKHYHERNVLIATIDDDSSYGSSKSTFLCRLIHQFKRQNQSSIVTVRARRIGMCNRGVSRYTQYESWGSHYSPGHAEMMLLPIGTGGALYRPEFFHPVVFSPTFRNLTNTADDIAFRLSTLALNVSVAMAASKCPTKFATLNQKKRSQTTYRNFTIQFENAIPYKEKPYVRSPAVADATVRHGRSLSNFMPPVALFRINWAGKNDESFYDALDFLKGQDILPNFNNLISQYSKERGDDCYRADSAHKNASRGSRMCVTYNCSIGLKMEKPGNIGAVYVNISRLTKGWQNTNVTTIQLV